MTLKTTTHLNFHGEAAAALEFYRDVFGGELTAITYAQFGMPHDAPGAGNVVFGQLEAPNGFRVMAYDTPAAPASTGSGSTAAPHTVRHDGMTHTTETFFLSLSGDSLDELAAVWDRLAEGATIIEPYGPAPWAPAFGMLTDRYGVTWILDVTTNH